MFQSVTEEGTAESAEKPVVSVLTCISRVSECDGGRYGRECRETCGQCEGDEACHHVNGNCSACSGDFLLPLCKVKGKQYKQQVTILGCGNRTNVETWGIQLTLRRGGGWGWREDPINAETRGWGEGGPN